MCDCFRRSPYKAVVDRILFYVFDIENMSVFFELWECRQFLGERTSGMDGIHRI
jgi:hypothetical protein